MTLAEFTYSIKTSIGFEWIMLLIIVAIKYLDGFYYPSNKPEDGAERSPNDSRQFVSRETRPGGGTPRNSWWGYAARFSKS